MPNRPRQDLVARSQRFSVRLLRFLEPLFTDPRMSRRFCENLAAAGTAIAHNISEAQSALSRRQMAQCYVNALREAREARTALAVTRDIPKGDPAEVVWLHAETDEFVAILHVSVTRLRESPHTGAQPVRRDQHRPGRQSS